MQKYIFFQCGMYKNKRNIFLFMTIIHEMFLSLKIEVIRELFQKKNRQ